MESHTPWQERVIAEEKELSERIEKLETFRVSDRFKALSWGDQLLLTEQLAHMCGYDAILIMRIARFVLD